MLHNYRTQQTGEILPENWTCRLKGQIVQYFGFRNKTKRYEGDRSFFKKNVIAKYSNRNFADFLRVLYERYYFNGGNFGFGV